MKVPFKKIKSHESDFQSTIRDSDHSNIEQLQTQNISVKKYKINI